MKKPIYDSYTRFLTTTDTLTGAGLRFNIAKLKLYRELEKQTMIYFYIIQAYWNFLQYKFSKKYRAKYAHIIEERIMICECNCKYYIRGKCYLCGCFIEPKAAGIFSQNCPDHKWPKIKLNEKIRK